MHFKISKEFFQKGLSFVQTITSKKTTMPILNHVLIDAANDRIMLRATDLELGVELQYPAEIIAAGSCLLHSKNLYDAIVEFPRNEIDVVRQENNWVNVSSGKIFFNLVGLDSREYPKIPDYKKKGSFNFPGHTFLEMINKTLFSTSKDPSRQSFNGCLAEKKEINGKKIIRFVSTDSHRLSLIDREIDEWESVSIKKSIIIPRKGLIEIKKALEECLEPSDVTIDDNHLIFSGKNVVIVMRLLDGKFVDYNKVIPSNNDKIAIIDRERIIESLKRVAVASSDVGDTIKCIKFNFSQNRLELSTKSASVGDAREDFEIEYDGPPLTIGFNATYFIESLQSADSEKINFCIEHELSPGIVKFVNVPDYLNVVMPMRI